MNQVSRIAESLDATVLRGMSDEYLQWCVEKHAQQVRHLQEALNAAIEEARAWATLVDASDRPENLKQRWLNTLALPR